MQTVTTPFSSSVLVVDDEPVVLDLFKRVLGNRGMTVRTARNAEEAFALIEHEGFGCVLADKNLPGLDGIELIRRVRQVQPYCACIVMTGYASTASAVEALRLGAVDYIEKPFDDLDRIAARVDDALKAMKDEYDRQVLLAKLRVVQGSEAPQNDAPEDETIVEPPVTTRGTRRSRSSKPASTTRPPICAGALCTCSRGWWPPRRRGARSCSPPRRCSRRCASCAAPATALPHSWNRSNRSSRSTCSSHVTRRAADVGGLRGFPRAPAPAGSLLALCARPYARLPLEAPRPMRFRSRIFTVLAMVGVVPAAVLGWLSFTVNRAELVQTVGAAQAQVAAEVARSCERFVAQGAQALSQAMSVLPLEDLSDAELATALRIPYRQLELVDALQIPPGPAVWESGNGRPAPELELLRERAPVQLAARAGLAIGGPYAGADARMRLPIALRLRGSRVLTAELSLDQLSRQLLQASSGGSVAYLATREGTVLAQPVPAPLTASERALLHDRGVRMLERADGQSWLAAAAPVGTLGWTVVVAQPESAALRPAALVRRYTLFWVAVSLLLVGVLGALLSRHVTERVRKLREGVQALREGSARKLEVEGADEIGELSRAFGEMAGEIVRRDEEIRRWNAVLQERVEERTAELRVAQEQMLRTRRLAALGTLGAGVAHELNNPLTAICGMAGLLRKDLAGTRHEEEVRVLQEQARRVSKIVSDLRAFADQEREGAGKKFPLAASVMAALDLYEGQMRARGIQLSTELTTCEAQGDPAQMQQAVAHLLQNAITAMPAGGTLKVTLSEVEGAALRLSVSDTGKGIPPALRERIFDPFFTTKENREGVGLGLSISHSIVEAHHGKLVVESAEGHGATFTIVLPAAAGMAHLR